MHKIITGDCRTWLARMQGASVHCCVTSPPYFGLRDYGIAEQIGLEKTPQQYVDELVAVFREVRRVLRDDGTLWLNLGDSYAGSGRGGNPDAGTKQGTNRGSQTVGVLYGRERESADAERTRMKETNAVLYESGLKPKDLIGIPWRVAFALQADGWYLRQDIIWAKPNPMPESVKDRCTKSHEYIFMLSKSPKYYYDSAAVAEPAIYSGLKNQDANGFKNAGRFKGKYASDKQSGHGRRHAGFNKRWDDMNQRGEVKQTRNKRSVWTVAPKPFREAHFATFPPELIEPCIKAGSPEGGVVLDPFGGAGTTALVARNLNRHAVLMELNPEYVAIAEKRLLDTK